MNLFESIRNKMNEIAAQRKESAEFRKHVEDEVRPIRRAAYLEAKKKSALVEGEAIAAKELLKLQEQAPKQGSNPFNLPDISKMINTEPYFKKEKKK